jgi:hypothetical protein
VVELERAGNIAGLVLDARTGDAVEAFSVKVVHLETSGGSRRDLGRITIDGLREGVFLIEGISPGTATLLIESSGYARKEVWVEVVNGKTSEEVFYLDGEAYLYGDISLNGEPRDAQVTIRITGQGMEDWGYLHSKDAHYEVKGLKGGNYTVGAAFHFEGNHATTWLMDRKRVNVESGERRRVDFHFRGTAAIRGVVNWREPAESRHGPWSGEKPHAYIIVVDNGVDASLPEDQRTRANAYKMERFDGLYEISNLAAGSYTVVGMVRKKEGGELVHVAEERRTVVLEAGQVAEVDFAFP